MRGRYFMGKFNIQQRGSAVVVKVKVVPGSSRTAIGGLLDGMLKVKVAAPAEKGKANAALIELFAKKLSIRKSAVRIVTGLTSGIKEIVIEGVSAEQITGLTA
jgi:uncharacterized protein (TIGR00251 family)